MELTTASQSAMTNAISVNVINTSTSTNNSNGTDNLVNITWNGGKIILTIIFILIIFLSLIGNCLVCLAILTEKYLRKAGNYFLLSLAVSDLLVGGLVVPFAGLNYLLDGRWMFGKNICKGWLSLDIMCSTASIFNLCAVSWDRYLHVQIPLHYHLKMTQAKALVIIGGIWLASTFISFLPIYLDWHVIDNYKFNDSCQMQLNMPYAVLSSFFSFFLPCIIMIIIYTKMYISAARHANKVQKLCRINRQNFSLTTNRKAAKTLGIIMGTFLICWLPFFIVNVVSTLCNNRCITATVYQIVTWLGYVNSTLNPIIYSIFNTEFRNAFYKLLCMTKCLIFIRRRKVPMNNINDTNYNLNKIKQSQTTYTLVIQKNNEINN